MSMNSVIYCQETARGIHSFYVRVQGRTYFLFSQNYHRGVAAYFRNPVCIDRALQHAGACGDRAILHTMEKLPAYIKYVEREYGVNVFRKTGRDSVRIRTCVA